MERIGRYTETPRFASMRLIILAALMLAVAVSVFMPEKAMAASVKPEQVTIIKTSAEYDSITLNWKESAGATKYIVYRSKSKYGLYQKLNTVSQARYTDKNLETGKAQWYKIRAINEDRRARKSPRISAVPMLSAPELTAEAAGEGIYLTLKKVPGADGYVIYRDGKSLSTQRTLTYLDSDIFADKEHRYKAVAYRHVNKKVIPSEFSREKRATRPSMNIMLKGNNILESIHEGEQVKLKGKIRSNTTIKEVRVGFVSKDSDKWISKQKYTNTDVDGMTFDLKKVNKKISTDQLAQGEYYYKIIVTLKTGSEKTILNQGFEVIQPPGSTMILEKAYELAWPKGTSSSTYSYPNGRQTDAYLAALSQAYGSRSGWSAQTRAGASCDVFVGTTIRASGYDTTFPRGLDEIESYCRAHQDKWLDTGITSESEMEPGDVLFQLYSGGGGHIAIYLGDGLVANAHYHGKSYGVIQDMHNGGGISRNSWKTFKVYRPIQ